MSCSYLPSRCIKNYVAEVTVSSEKESGYVTSGYFKVLCGFNKD